MTLNPSINLCFNGQCEAAFKFYEQHLGGKMVFKLTWGDSPMASDAPPGWSEKLMHARLIVGETALLGSDVAPASYEAPRGFAMMLDVDKPEDADRLFHALAENGKVGMPLQQTFWALRFGSVTDQFGIPWAINCETPQ